MNEELSSGVGPARSRFGALLTRHLLKNPGRGQRKYPNNAFAKAIGVTPPTIGNWRRGTSLPETEERLEKAIHFLFRDVPGYEKDKEEIRLAWRLGRQEPYPYRSRGPNVSGGE